MSSSAVKLVEPEEIEARWGENFASVFKEAGAKTYT